MVTNLPLITASKLMNKLLDLGHLMYLPRFLPNFIYTYLHLYLPTYVPTYICTYLHLYLLTYVPTYICTYLHVPTYLHLYLPTFVPTNICTHQHLYLPTFVPTCICTYHLEDGCPDELDLKELLVEVRDVPEEDQTFGEKF